MTDDLSRLADEIARKVATSAKSGRIHAPVYYAAKEAAELALRAAKPAVRVLDEWHEDHGNAVWWALEDGDWLGEPAWIGTPNDSDWPGYHTHWTPHPDMPPIPDAAPEPPGEGERSDGERLIEAVKEARAIARGEMEPAAVHHVRVTGSGDDSAIFKLKDSDQSREIRFFESISDEPMLTIKPDGSVDVPEKWRDHPNEAAAAIFRALHGMGADPSDDDVEGVDLDIVTAKGCRAYLSTMTTEQLGVQGRAHLHNLDAAIARAAIKAMGR